MSEKVIYSPATGRWSTTSLSRGTILLGAFIGIITVAVSALALLRPSAKLPQPTPLVSTLAASAAPTTPVIATSPGSKERKLLGFARVTLTRRGFQPAEITRPAGQFLLAVDNRSEVDQLTFRLERDNKSRLHEKQLPKGGVKWREVVDLPPGHYVLAEAAHPEWTCRINITAR